MSNLFSGSNNEFRDLIRKFNNLKNGLSDSYLEEDDFERLIDHLDDQEKYNEAIQAAEYGINQYPFSAGLLLQKANLLIVTNKSKEALLYINQAELIDATDPSLYVLKCDALLAQDKNEEAFEAFEEGMKQQDGEDLIDYLFEMSEVFDDYDDFEKVFDCLKLILELDQTNDEALYKICFWTDFTGRNEESIRLHQEILEEHPFCELAWFNLGAAYQGLRLHEKAIDAYLYAIAINERFDYAYRNLSDAYIRIRKYPEAIESLKQVVAISSDHDNVIYEAMGFCYDKLTKYADARICYKKAIEINPEDSQLVYKVGCTYMNESNWKVAAKELETAVKMQKGQADYNLALGQCYMEMGEFEKAITHLGFVVRTRPRNSNGWIQLLNCIHRSNDLEAGLEYSDFALEQTNQKPIFYFYKSMFLFELGQSKEAAAVLEIGMQQNPKLIRKFLEMIPEMLQYPKVVDMISRYKRKSKK